MLLRRNGDDVNVVFQPRADALVRTAEACSSIQNEILRQQVEQHAVALQADLGSHFDGHRQVVGGDFVGAAKFIQAAALGAFYIDATGAERD